MLKRLFDFFFDFSFFNFLFSTLLNTLKNNAQILQIIFDFLVSVSTFIAVYVAINQKKIEMKFGGPRLIAAVSNYKFSKVHRGSSKETILEEYRFLEVRNIGYSTARKVKCKVNKITGSNNSTQKGNLEFPFEITLPWHLKNQFNITENQVECDILPNEALLLNFVGIYKNSNAPRHVFFLTDGGPITDWQNMINLKEDMHEQIFIEIFIYCENSLAKPQYFWLFRDCDNFKIIEVDKNSWKRAGFKQ